VPDDTFRFVPDGLPEELLDAEDRTLLRALGGPTLVRYPGGDEQPPRAVATLLHGDEPTGFQAMLHLLRERPRLPYDLYVLVGNVRAALEPPGYAHRYLDDQEDLNRIWAPSSTTTPLREAATEALRRLRAAGVAALVDLHDTSGDNPAHAIVTRVRPATLNLATLFTPRIVHWELPNGALVEALQDGSHAVGIELGRAGQQRAFDRAVAGLRRYLTVPDVDTASVLRDHHLLTGLHRVTVRPEVRLRFGGELSDDLDLVVPSDADRHNFVEVGAGHTLGRVHPGTELPVEVVSPDGRRATGELLAIDGDRIVLTRPAVPVMMTRTVTAVRKDCLVYLAVDPTRPSVSSTSPTSIPANRSSSVRSKGTSERSST
jgi:succinylglutamate desuccinylase